MEPPSKLPDSTYLINFAEQNINLRHSEMQEWWKLAQLENVYRAMPGIASLEMTGDAHGDGIEYLFPTVSHFRILTGFGLANASSLHMGFDPPVCGNVFDGHNEE
ncbi:hypothetical protein G7Y79_00042g078580 [Physcia stellaris]|nr:hypothetical protein G7Y79_00042g078580 [Physcia stellaris]